MSYIVNCKDLKFFYLERWFVFLFCIFWVSLENMILRFLCDRNIGIELDKVRLMKIFFLRFIESIEWSGGMFYFEKFLKCFFFFVFVVSVDFGFI